MHMMMSLIVNLNIFNWTLTNPSDSYEKIINIFDIVIYFQKGHTSPLTFTHKVSWPTPK